MDDNNHQEATWVPPTVEDDPTPRLQHLKTRARQAIIQATADGFLCEEGADEALSDMGLPPLVRKWTCRGRLPVSFDHLTFTDVDHVVDHAYRIVAAACTTALGVDIGGVRVIRATPVDDHPAQWPRRYQVTVHVALAVPVDATEAKLAITTARNLVHDHAGQLGPFTPDLDNLAWDDDPGQEPLDLAAQASHPDPVASPNLPRTQRVEAQAELATLRRRIRAVAIAALNNGLLGDEEDTYQRVDEFLAELGLDPLPRVRVFEVEVLRTTTVTADDAFTAGHAGFRACTRDMAYAARQGLPAELVGRSADGDATHVAANTWQQRWRQLWQVRLRSEATAQAAATTIRQALPDATTRELERIDDIGMRIDRRLDPDDD